MAVFNLEDCSASRAPGRLLRRLDKVMSAFVDSRINAGDLSYQQWVALKVVRDGLADTAGELARELGITTGATTRLIDVLETRKLLARDRSGEDRRVVRLMTTELGSKRVETLQGDVVGAWNEVIAPLSQDEANQFVTMLARILVEAERVAGVAPLVEDDQ
ncbi:MULTISPECIES: MarR family winged helix-turn-helix transcriptional regulator [Sphingomonas]|uniref:MarR family winged helix-turn-helix transcriptional regulator n=1 Tax=Sphingomonas TaxID=13687 RepID=UPI0024130E28|nr:MarR family winged helix-turn-helix transcriptional regulator [Sphingomonas echinoides]